MEEEDLRVVVELEVLQCAVERVREGLEAAGVEWCVLGQHQQRRVGLPHRDLVGRRQSAALPPELLVRLLAVAGAADRVPNAATGVAREEHVIVICSESHSWEAWSFCLKAI